MDRDLSAMADFASVHKVRLRPHAKMHKRITLAKMQIAVGTVGICVQKTPEAEIMVAGGIHDVFITSAVIAPLKLTSIAALTRAVLPHGGRIAICVDSMDGITRLATIMNESRVASGVATAIDVFIETNVGHNRCGVEPGRCGAGAGHTQAPGPDLRRTARLSRQGAASAPT